MSPYFSANDDEYEPSYTSLSSDTYSLMMITKPFNKSWSFAFGIFILVLLGVLYVLEPKFQFPTFLYSLFCYWDIVKGGSVVI